MFYGRSVAQDAPSKASRIDTGKLHARLHPTTRNDQGQDTCQQTQAGALHEAGLCCCIECRLQLVRNAPVMGAYCSAWGGLPGCEDQKQDDDNSGATVTPGLEFEVSVSCVRICNSA